MKNSSKNTNTITPFEKQCLDVSKMIMEYKIACEANVCAILYKNPSYLIESNISLTDFHNNTWKVYFAIIYGIIKVEKKGTIDEIIVGMYLEKHLKLKEKYNEYGGWKLIEDAKTYVKEEAFYGYLSELRKWGIMLQLASKGWIDKTRMSEYADMTAEDIYNELQVYINDIFINIDNNVKSYDISSGLSDLIDELDEGLAIGLPYYNMPILTNETGGEYLGGITLLGGLSNVGKSTFARTALIPSIIKNNEKIVVMLNEDGVKKWQREMLVFVANNILNYDLQKYVLRDGNFSNEIKDILYKAANWIEDNTKNHMITLVPFTSYQTSNVIKVIKKYAGLGVKYFLLDTFKMDAGKVSDKSWLEMQQNMVAINDVVKPESNNLHILITFQLAKGSSKQRYYTQDNIGLAKNIIDPASTCLMIRNLYDDEYTGENKELKVFKTGGHNNKSKIQVKLDHEKRYQIVFIIKNREGGANQFQIVMEHDMSRNIVKEIGTCSVPIDW